MLPPRAAAMTEVRALPGGTERLYHHHAEGTCSEDSPFLPFPDVYGYDPSWEPELWQLALFFLK